MFMHLLSKVLVVPRKKKFFHFTYPLRNSGKQKQRSGSTSGDSEEPIAKKRKTQFKQYPHLFSEPPTPLGEDESSFSRNNKVLLSNERRSKPNEQTTNTLMDRTFAFRRREILKTRAPISAIIKLYPSLKRIQQVSNFFLFCTISIQILCYNSLWLKWIASVKKKISADARSKWMKVMPNILKVAEAEDDSAIQSLARIDDAENNSMFHFSLIRFMTLCLCRCQKSYSSCCNLPFTT